MATCEDTTTREIPLTRGYVAIVDAADFEWLNEFKWTAIPREGYCTAMRCEGPRTAQRFLLMHREILNAPKGSQVDHVNGNALDNRRSNLRLATPSQNQWNKRKKRGGSSQYKGVRWHKSGRVWEAAITQFGKYIYIGQFHNEEDAARAYDAKARELFGEYAKPNFSDEP